MNSVCIIKGGNWICTGSNDKLIHVYQVNSKVPFLVLKGHSDTVCTLSSTDKDGIVLSGSWDKTAKLWTVNEQGYSCVTFQGHEAAVWAVCQLPNNRYATGSADKLIAIWNSLGEKLLILKGHTDCVRGLIPLPNGSLLSVSNDATVRLWNDSWECVKEFHGHTNYIYSIALNPINPNAFATVGEDGLLHVWNLQSGSLEDAIKIPSQSIWAVTYLPDGDIVTACSDGFIRLFTLDSNKFASDEQLAKFNEAVAIKTNQSMKVTENLIKDLPGPEALFTDGTEGQTKVIKNEGKVMCYQWTNGKWEFYGEMVGYAGDNKSEKPFFNGKHYDYVFDIDTKDGEPPLKLPYNLDEDPWKVSRKFIEDNDLPIVYMEQVANFIITNSQQSTMLTSR